MLKYLDSLPKAPFGKRTKGKKDSARLAEISIYGWAGVPLHCQKKNASVVQRTGHRSTKPGMEVRILPEAPMESWQTWCMRRTENPENVVRIHGTPRHGSTGERLKPPFLLRKHSPFVNRKRTFPFPQKMNIFAPAKKTSMIQNGNIFTNQQCNTQCSAYVAVSGCELGIPFHRFSRGN